MSQANIELIVGEVKFDTTKKGVFEYFLGNVPESINLVKFSATQNSAPIIPSTMDQMSVQNPAQVQAMQQDQYYQMRNVSAPQAFEPQSPASAMQPQRRVQRPTTTRPPPRSEPAVVFNQAE
jgi:hypothetical protein